MGIVQPNGQSHCNCEKWIQIENILKSLKFSLDEKLDYLATVIIYYLERTQRYVHYNNGYDGQLLCSWNPCSFLPAVLTMGSVLPNGQSHCNCEKWIQRKNECCIFFATRRHPGLLKILNFPLDEKWDYLATVIIYYLERTQRYVHYNNCYDGQLLCPWKPCSFLPAVLTMGIVQPNGQSHCNCEKWIQIENILKSLKFSLDEKLDYLATVIIYYLERTQRYVHYNNGYDGQLLCSWKPCSFSPTVLTMGIVQPSVL